MDSKAFAAKAVETAGGLNGDYGIAAGPADLENGYQAIAYAGTNFGTGRRDYRLFAADTDPASTAFEMQTFRPGEVDVDGSGITFEEVEMETLRGLGSVTLPYPE